MGIVNILIEVNPFQMVGTHVKMPDFAIFVGLLKTRKTETKYYIKCLITRKL